LEHKVQGNAISTAKSELSTKNTVPMTSFIWYLADWNNLEMAWSI